MNIPAYDIKELTSYAWMHYEIVRRPNGKYLRKADVERWAASRREPGTLHRVLLRKKALEGLRLLEETARAFDEEHNIDSDLASEAVKAIREYIA